jgi:uncharacterized protein YukE
MPDFQADTGQLDDAAGRLRGVAGALQGDYGGVSSGAMGFPSAEAAVTNFVVAWTAGGTNLANALDAVSKGVTQAAGNYSRAEQTNAIVGWHAFK